MAALNQLLQTCLIKLIQVYRFAFSALLGPCCRFEPSCSTYAMSAIKKYGCLRGCYLSIKRVLCCHPWHPGGFDPIP